MRSSDAVEEVEFLLQGGNSAADIPARLGVRADSLARSLHRAGRTDLARQFWRVAAAERGAQR